MSAEYKNQDLNKIAQDAERDLNTDAAKKGHGGSDSSMFSQFLSFPQASPDSNIIHIPTSVTLY
jgi:hypothetical protein